MKKVVQSASRYIEHFRIAQAIMQKHHEELMRKGYFWDGADGYFKDEAITNNEKEDEHE